MPGKRARRCNGRGSDRDAAGDGVGGLSSVLADNGGEFNSFESDVNDEGEEEAEEEDVEDEEDEEEEGMRCADFEGEEMNEEDEEGEGEVQGAQEGVAEKEGGAGHPQQKTKFKPIRRLVRMPDGRKVISREYLKMAIAMMEMEVFGASSERFLDFMRCIAPAGVNVLSRAELAEGVRKDFNCAKGRMQRALAREVQRGTKVGISTEILFVPCCIWLKASYLEDNPREYRPQYRTGDELPECRCDNRKAFFVTTAHWLESVSWARRACVIHYAKMICPVEPHDLVYDVENSLEEWGLEGSVMALVTDETVESIEFAGQWLLPSSDSEEEEEEEEDDDWGEDQDKGKDEDKCKSENNDDNNMAKQKREFREYMRMEVREEARKAELKAAAAAGAPPPTPRPVTAAAGEAGEEAGVGSVDIPKVRHLLCYSRAVVHAVRTLLEIDEFLSLVEKMRVLAEVMENSAPKNKVHRLAFGEALREVLGADARVKEVITYSAAVTAKVLRWDGAYELLCRALKMRPAVDKWAASLTDQTLRERVEVSPREWEVASHIFQVMQPFVAFNRWQGIKPLDEWEWDHGQASQCGDFPPLHSFIPHYGLLLLKVRELVSSVRYEMKRQEKGKEQDVEMASGKKSAAQPGGIPTAAGPSDVQEASPAGAYTGEKARADSTGKEAASADSVNEGVGATPAPMIQEQKDEGNSTSSQAAAAASVADLPGAQAAVLARLEAAAAVLEQQWQWRDELAVMAVVLDPRFRLAFFDTPAGNAIMPADKVRRMFSALVLRYAEGTSLHFPQGSGADTEDKVSAEIRTYVSEERLAKDADVLAYWRRNATRLPLLAKAARDYLAVPAATMRVGRLGSYTDRRFDEVRNAGAMEDTTEVEMMRLAECLRSWSTHPECGDL